ncbi:Os02g0677450 [Oryza sativa Japonica Group]|uniref:Os02g0677450 protein n=1 Tax=Oryza sativa subsp. japonica TaxID=39947 RepID=A0A0P0VMY7_ORYSJ|nr:Os02g0677450 [Oryza sativa Japonica Group]
MLPDPPSAATTAPDGEDRRRRKPPFLDPPSVDATTVRSTRDHCARGRRGHHRRRIRPRLPPPLTDLPAYAAHAVVAVDAAVGTAVAEGARMPPMPLSGAVRRLRRTPPSPPQGRLAAGGSPPSRSTVSGGRERHRCLPSR